MPKKDSEVNNIDEYRRRIRRVRNVLIWIFAASFAVFVTIAILAVINEGVQKFVATLFAINLWYYGAAFAIVFLSYLLRYPKWELYMQRLGVKISRKRNLAIYLSMYSMEITPGRWGRSVVSYTINKLTNVRFGHTFPAIVADIFTDFFGFIVICLGAAFFLGQYVILSLFITILLMVPFIFLYVKGPYEFIKRRFGHIKRLRIFFENASLYFKSNTRLGFGVYAYSMLFTIPSMLLNGIALYFVILAFGVSLPLSAMPEVIFIFSSSLLIGIVTGIPAALGVTDAAMISYLTIFFGGMGVDFGLASIITIFFRIVNVWFVEGFGFTALAYTFKYWELPSTLKKVPKIRLPRV